MHAHIALCLATGIRTEEARAMRWEHITFGGPDADPQVPTGAAVWCSVRSRGDTKIDKSRQTLALPQMAVDALRVHNIRSSKPQTVAQPRRQISCVARRWLTTSVYAAQRKFVMCIPGVKAVASTRRCTVRLLTGQVRHDVRGKHPSSAAMHEGCPEYRRVAAAKHSNRLVDGFPCPSRIEVA